MSAHRFAAPTAQIDDRAEHDTTRMHPDIAGMWNVWSTVVGRIAARRLEQVKENFPEMVSAIVATADGLNICSLGLDEDDAGRLAALNSSLFGVARAETRIMMGPVLGNEDGTHSNTAASRVERTSVIISSGNAHTAVLAFVIEPYGMLLLGISAQDVLPGILLVRARQTARLLLETIGQQAVQT
jgi:predicted regulator of Ras-like GTPase activity (Roadblock/LC7/MglB family)